MMNTGLKPDEYDWMKRLEAGIDKAWHELTEWEQRFMENRLEAFRRYGVKTRISKAQWKIIDRISEKIL